MNRRDVLTAVPAAGLGAFLAGPGAAHHDTPVLTAFREWRAILKWADGPEARGMSDEEFEPINERRHEMEERLFALPSQGPVDVLAKLAAFTYDGRDFAGDDGTWADPLMAEMVGVVDKALGRAP